MKIITETIACIKIGTPSRFGNLTLFPLTDGGRHKADYLTLDEALAGKSAHITEVSESGSVPELSFVNEGDKAVFLLDGEELIGAKQNRVLNLSILVAAGKTLIIPVSCVERGRWHHRSREFSSAQRAQYAEARAKRMAQVSDSIKFHGRPFSDQGAVWDDIDEKLRSFSMASPTSAMSDIFEQQSRKLDEYVGSFKTSEGQTGVMFAINGKIMGFDLFDCAETLQKLFPKLMRSYALDALDSATSKDAKAKIPSPASAAKFLQSVRRAEMTTSPAIGEGEDVRLSARNTTGAALAIKERVIHMGAFRLAADATRKPKTPPMY